jgi:hypothetical protein
MCFMSYTRCLLCHASLTMLCLSTQSCSHCLRLGIANLEENNQPLSRKKNHKNISSARNLCTTRALCLLPEVHTTGDCKPYSYMTEPATHAKHGQLSSCPLQSLCSPTIISWRWQTTIRHKSEQWCDRHISASQWPQLPPKVCCRLLLLYNSCNPISWD